VTFVTSNEHETTSASVLNTHLQFVLHFVAIHDGCRPSYFFCCDIFSARVGNQSQFVYVFIEFSIHASFAHRSVVRPGNMMGRPVHRVLFQEVQCKMLPLVFCSKKSFFNSSFTIRSSMRQVLSWTLMALVLAMLEMIGIG